MSDKNFSSELDLLSMHPKMEYMFLPIELSQKNPLKKTGEKIRICHTPTNRYYKGSKKIIDVCSQIANENNNVEFILIEKAEHEKVLKIKKTCDILIDQIGNRGGIGYGMNSVESMALGLCCMTEMTDECNAFFKDHPFIKLEGVKGFIASKFNSNSYLNSSQFGLKWNRNNLFFNLSGEYSISSDYRLPNKQYLFNSRFKQNAIKFSISSKKNNLQNIFRYQLHNESPGIPGHVHGDPSIVDLTKLLSSDDIN